MSVRIISALPTDEWRCVSNWSQEIPSPRVRGRFFINWLKRSKESSIPQIVLAREGNNRMVAPLAGRRTYPREPDG